MHGYHFFWPMFWGLFALAIILTRRFTRHRERMRALDLTQLYIDKGVQPPEVLTQTLTRAPCEPRTPADDIRRGAILIAVAVGMAIFGFVLDIDDLRMGHGGGLNPLVGAAAIPGLIGLVILAFGLAGRNKA